MTQRLPHLYKRLGTHSKLAKKLIADSTQASILALADLCEDYLPVVSTESARQKDIREWRTIAGFLPVLEWFSKIRTSGASNYEFFRYANLFTVECNGSETAKVGFSVCFRPGHAYCRTWWNQNIDSLGYLGRDWFDYINYKRLHNARFRLDIARNIELHFRVVTGGYSGVYASKTQPVEF